MRTADSTLPGVAAGRQQAVRAIAPGDSVGRYRIVGRLGAGAMGVVYAAVDPELDRRVAVKLLNERARRPTARARLLREARALAQLSHPNVVAVHDAGVIDDVVFLAMELVEGVTLAAWLSEPQRRTSEIVEAFRQAGRGLAAAHASGLVHRDFKPSNAMVDASGRVRVTDFGLVRGGGTPSQWTTLADTRSTDDAAHLTRRGRVLGTPAYMAPEQFLGSAVDSRADQFSFCVALWEALYGIRPFDTSQRCELAAMGTPRTSKDRAVPRWLRRVLTRGLQPEPRDRWPDMNTLVSALSRSSARRNVLTLGAALIAVSSASAFASTRLDDEVCQGARAEAQTFWSAERRDAVRDSILGDGGAWRRGEWERTEARLDAWTHDWVEAHTSACRATRVHGVQSEGALDLRMACLNRAAVTMDVTVEALSSAPSAAERAQDILAGLVALDPCADVERLREGRRLPPADEVDAVAAASKAVQRAVAQARAGQYRRAMKTLDAAAPLVTSLDYDPLTIDAEIARGQLLIRTGRPQEAERVQRRAARMAGETHDRAALRDATIDLVRNLGVAQERTSDAIALLDVAAGLASDVPAARTRLRIVEARIRAVAGDPEAAETAARLALAEVLAQPEATTEAVLDARATLAHTLNEVGRAEQAEAELVTAFEVAEASLGTGHPRTAGIAHDLAAAHIGLGRYAAAEEELRTVVEVQRAVRGARHRDVADAQADLGSVLLLQGKLEEGEGHLRAACETLRDVLGPEHAATATVAANWASALQHLGRLDEAQSVMRESLANTVRSRGATHLEVGYIRTQLSGVLVAQGQHADAQDQARQALTIFQAALDERHPAIAQAHHILGVALARAGDDSAAAEAYGAALKIREATLGAEHPETRQVRQAHAAALERLGTAATR